MKKKEKIAIFGYLDSLAGQLINYMKISDRYHIEYVISISELPIIDIAAEHNKRPHHKTEFVIGNKFYGIPVFVENRYLEKLEKDGIKKVAVFEHETDVRSKIISSIKKTQIEILSFIHPSVFLGGDNTLGTGVIIFPNCFIGYKSDIGDGTIMQSNCIIEHHNKVGDFTNISPGLTTGGFTRIGDFVEINMSVDIINRIYIENRSVIGAGSLVLDNCKASTLYYGRPAKAIRKI